MSAGEEWRPIAGWPGYFVSNHGRVLATRQKRRRILSNRENPGGYRYVFLYEDGRPRNRCVHALVLQAFVGPRPDGMECRHLDGDKTNNRVENLRWGPRSENTRDQVRHGTHNNARKTHCAQGHPFDEINTAHRSQGRVCRTCDRAAGARYRQARREMRAAA